MERESRRTLPFRRPNSAGETLVHNKALQRQMQSAEFRELLERTRDGLLALGGRPDAAFAPVGSDSERPQREVDGVIARWKARRPETQHDQVAP